MTACIELKYLVTSCSYADIQVCVTRSETTRYSTWPRDHLVTPIETPDSDYKTISLSLSLSHTHTLYGACREAMPPRPNPHPSRPNSMLPAARGGLGKSLARPESREVQAPAPVVLWLEAGVITRCVRSNDIPPSSFLGSFLASIIAQKSDSRPAATAR